ncbi:MAG: hypothetical protein K8F62_15380 [Pseudorhodoplanes sp.]|nr:hypothetical protein [Pseudorhodoplanes sp.]
MKRVLVPASLIVVVFAGLSLAWAQHGHHNSGAPGAAGNDKDQREFVRFPDALRDHTLANMRDHLLALQEIQEALGRGQEDVAGRIAEQRLGMSSLSLHGAHEVAKYMPQGMQDVGTTMHRSASRFAIEAQNAGVTGDLKPALQALSTVTAACVGCHAAYRLQ